MSISSQGKGQTSSKVAEAKDIVNMELCACKNMPSDQMFDFQVFLKSSSLCLFSELYCLICVQLPCESWGSFKRNNCWMSFEAKRGQWLFEVVLNWDILNLDCRSWKNDIVHLSCEYTVII